MIIHEQPSPNKGEDSVKLMAKRASKLNTSSFHPQIELEQISEHSSSRSSSQNSHTPKKKEYKKNSSEKEKETAKFLSENTARDSFFQYKFGAVTS